MDAKNMAVAVPNTTRYFTVGERIKVKVHDPPKPWDTGRSSVHHLRSDRTEDYVAKQEDKKRDDFAGHGRGSHRGFDPLSLFRKTPDEFLLEAHEQRKRLGINPLVGVPVKQPLARFNITVFTRAD
jgi:hypothetical protein